MDTSTEPLLKRLKIEDEAWINLKTAIDGVFRKEPMSRVQYMSMYTRMTNLCKGGNITTELEAMTQVYAKVKQCYKENVDRFFQDLTDLSGDTLLASYSNAWTNFKEVAKRLNGIFSYLNRNFITLDNLLPITSKNLILIDLCMLLWKQSLDNNLQPKLTDAILQQIEMARDGHKSIDTDMLAYTIKSFVEIGIDEKNPFPKVESLEVYKASFEDQFLLTSEEYFSTKMSSLQQEQTSNQERLRQIDRWFQEEEDKAKICFHETTWNQLSKIMIRVTVEPLIETMGPVFEKLLDEEQTEPMERIYRLASKPEEGLVHLTSIFERFVCQKGQLNIRTCDTKDPNSFIGKILETLKKFSSLIESTFKNDAVFVSALDNGAVEFINNNVVTEESSSKSAEFLAKYSHAILTNNDQSEQELEESLQNVTKVYSYLEDKDAFEKYYRFSLCNRILRSQSFSAEAEISMVEKLEVACGKEYSYKLKKMLQDCDVTKGLSDEFDQHLTQTNQSLGHNFKIKVLTSNSWPLSKSPPFLLPSSLEPSVRLFTEFYNTRHTGRKLTWLYHMSTGKLTTNCFSKRYTIHASTFQMSVLLQFNNSDKLTVGQLQESTQIPLDILVKVVQSLIRYKLVKLDDPESTGSIISDNTGLMIANDLNNKATKFSIDFPVKYGKTKGLEVLQENLAKDRNGALQAALVRTMKAKQSLTRDQLMVEVSKILAPRFKPVVKAIDDCIEDLVSRKYFKEENGMYTYIA